MDQGTLRLFTLDDGVYEAALLRDVELERGANGVVGRWTRFGLEAEGDSDADVYRDLLSLLHQEVGEDPTALRFLPLAVLMRELGRRLSPEELIEGEDAWLRDMTLPWTVDADHHYQVTLLQDVVIARGDGQITLRAFDITRVADDPLVAYELLIGAIGEACGTPEAPGPRFAEISAWVARNGRREAAGRSSTPTRDRATYAAAHDGLPDVEPADLERRDPTDLPLLVQFWGEHCAWCLVQAPVLVQLAEELSGRVVVGKLDADRHHEIAKRLGVHRLPVVLLMHGGREVHRIDGHRGLKTIVRELEPHLRRGHPR